MSDASDVKKMALPDIGALFRGRGEFIAALRMGLIYGGIFFALLFAWMALRAGDTALQLQDKVPSKTAMIEVPESQPNAEAENAAADPNAPGDTLSGPKNINALPPAPVEGLTESLNGKLLPTARIEDDLTPFQAYRRPFQMVAGRSMVSFVVMDYGLSETLAQSLLDNMPPDVTFALTPYAENPVKWASSARAFGHEFWMSLPMQGKDFGLSDSGPRTLLLNAPLEENQSRLFSVLGTAVGYAGVISGYDHVFSPRDGNVDFIMKQIYGRGLAFVESNPEREPFGKDSAKEFGYPYAQGTLWLDADLRPEAIDHALLELELQAGRTGKAIAFLRPYPVVVNKVQEWIKTAPDKGIQVAPLSALLE